MRKETGVLDFSLKVWITSVLTAPSILLIFLLFDKDHNGGFAGVMVIWIYAIFLGGLYSFPSFILFYLSSKIIYKQNWLIMIKIKKAVLVLAGAILTIAPFLIILGNELKESDSIYLKLLLSYTSTIIAGILYYRLSYTKEILL